MHFKMPHGQDTIQHLGAIVPPSKPRTGSIGGWGSSIVVASNHKSDRVSSNYVICIQHNSCLPR